MERKENARKSSHALSIITNHYQNQPNNRVLLGRYQIQKTIGKGTFGKVFLCLDVQAAAHSPHKQVAVKVIDHATIKTSRERKNVAREIRLAKLLKHPNIINIVNLWEEKEMTYFVMEWACHGELHDYIGKSKGLKESEARRFFRQILSAVDYCHQSSIVHRDLKPENLLLDANYNLKLIDFGFGNTYSECSHLTTYCGSPYYAAPEMTQGIPYTGPEVDIWSLGVILYIMLTGSLPFNGSSVNELYDAIATGQYPKSNKLSRNADDLLSEMLCVQPHLRITMEAIKMHPWVCEGYPDPLISYVPIRPTILQELDPKVLEIVQDLGYDRNDYYEAFRRGQDKSPVKSLYHLHNEMLHSTSSPPLSHTASIVPSPVQESSPVNMRDCSLVTPTLTELNHSHVLLPQERVSDPAIHEQMSPKKQAGFFNRVKAIISSNSSTSTNPKKACYKPEKSAKATTDTALL